MKKLYNKQRTMGFALIIISIITSILTDGDYTVLMLFAIPSMYLICTKEKVIYDDVDEDEEES